MKVLYTSHVNGDRSTVRHEVLEAESLEWAYQLINEGHDPHKDAKTEVNEFGIFTTDLESDLVESFVIIAR